MPPPNRGQLTVAATGSPDVGFGKDIDDTGRKAATICVRPRTHLAATYHYREPNLTTPTTLPPAEISEILRHIPHRYPFLLIDRVLACEPNKWVRAIKNVSTNDNFFAGVASGRRIMPQLLVVEALAQAAGVLCHYSGMMGRVGKSIIFFAGIENCRFGRDVVPGDQVTFECVLKRSMRGVAKLTGSALADGELVLSSELTAVVREMELDPKV